MSPAAHGTVGFRASPRLYRGKVLLLALAIVVVSLAEALQTEAREEAAAPAGAEGIERIVLDRAEGIERIVLDRAGAVVAPDAGVPAAPEVVFGGAAGPFAEPLPVSCAACGCNAHSLPLAPRAS